MQTSISGQDSPASLPIWSQRQTLTAFALIVAAWALAVSIWPLTGTVVPWDSKNQFYPTLRYLGSALANGELPLWNPYHFGGHPSAADPQSLLFTPTMLLFGWLVPEPSMELFDVVVFAHFLPGALAFVPLFRRRGWHPAGAVVAALVFMLGGSATARLQHTGMIFSYGFFPLAFWLLEEAMDRRSYVYGLLFAASAAMMVIGRDQVAFLCGLTLIVLATQRIWAASQPLAYLKSRLGLLVFMGLIGGALLAVPIVLTMQFLATSTRPSFGFGVAAMGSLPPESLATILFGNVFGSLRWTYDYWGPDWHSLSEGTWTDRATNYLFIGTIPALLLLWHGVAGGRLFAREFRFFLVMGIAATLYSLGRYTPGFVMIFDHMPGVDLYRRPADATFLINIALAFAAGYLVHRYATEGLPQWNRAALGRLRVALPLLALGLVAAAVASALVFAVKGGFVFPALTEIGGSLAVATLAIVVITRMNDVSRWREAIALVLVTLTGAELISRHAASALNAEPAERYTIFTKLPPEQLQGLQILKRELAERHAKGEYPRVEILGLKGAWQNASMVLGIEDTIGYNPLRLADYERAIGPGENAEDPNLRSFPTSFRGYNCELASLLGLDYVVLDRPVEKLPRHFPRLTDAEIVYGTGRMWIYRLNSSVPRAYVAHHVTPVDSEAVLGEDELPEFNRETEALIDDDSMPLLKGSYTAAGATSDEAKGQARIVSYKRNSVALDVESSDNGILVLHDINYPGWEAWVDGERRPILHANLLFRGVEIGPGRHRVEFYFRPMSLENLVAAASDLVKSEEKRIQTAIAAPPP
ncbi:YfhO family protein [Microvirga lotononidis]|uniref:Bacterial membrane protein YfhO n=1 Tax=Microvirga lotononidis TaxID=864069 RepID=I4Z2Y5_9HYPH|nr:YfhO family protein [Microvirga lotononidis]EIM30577.1 Bacterial membrane protein YfhO [Microvirga lotononidis]WQO26405.1 YfhO family protein [Microvirga lotononidis]